VAGPLRKTIVKITGLVGKPARLRGMAGASLAPRCVLAHEARVAAYVRRQNCGKASFHAQSPSCRRLAERRAEIHVSFTGSNVRLWRQHITDISPMDGDFRFWG
jgi:hypothetical protein